MVGKGQFNPVGWICEKCGNIKFDEKQFWLYRGAEQREKTNRRLIVDLMRTILKLKRSIRMNKEYIYTENNKENTDRITMLMFYRIKHEIATYNYLRGLRKGNKDSDKHWRERMEDEKLTDDQILKQAELINLKRKIGFEKF